MSDQHWLNSFVLVYNAYTLIGTPTVTHTVTQSPVMVGGVNVAAAVATPVVLVLLLLVICVMVVGYYYLRCHKKQGLKQILIL